MRRRLSWFALGTTLIANLVVVSAIVVGQKEDGSSPDIVEMLASGSQAVTLGDLVLEEAFDEDDAWENYSDDTSSLHIEDGVYRAEQTDDRYTIWGLNDQAHTDVIIVVDTQQRSDHLNNGYGVMCRAAVSNNGDGYYFFISGDGYYSIFVGDGGEYTTLVEWASSESIVQGTSDNQIAAVCVGDYLALYANGDLLAEVNDERLAGGYAGLAVTTYEGGAVDIAFDNLNIWEADSGGQGTGRNTTAVSLSDYAGEPEEAIAELESLNLIPTGGSLVFQEDYAYFNGIGNWFTPLAGRSPHADVVMAGELTFEIGDPNQFEVCLLTSRINTNSAGSATTFVDVGITNTGDLLITDISDEDESATTDEFIPLDINLGQPHYLLILAIDDTLTVFIDGEQIAADVPIVERAGTYGISLLGAGQDASCEGRNIWVYQVPSLTPGVCTVSAGSAVNRRTGPGTDFDSAGQLPAGQQETVQGQAVGSDGQVWWQLDDDSWVRDDVVNAVGDCASVPTVEA